ncbi:hypothetical protein Misp01_53580 [Microtetraspora sp. NBRC 13810]|nr:hypothetical protein Misp01_53580 [Microtetraspora sp. NBRC 13810]
MIVVLSGLRSMLEDVLAEQRVPHITLIPANAVADYRPAGDEFPRKVVADWEDYNALLSAAAQLEPMGVTNIVTMDETAVRAAAFLRGQLGVPGQNLHDAVAFTDKAIMKDRLRQAGIPVAGHRVVHGIDNVRKAAAEVGWPIVIKPRMGFGALNTYFVEGEAQFDELLAAGAFEPETRLPGAVRSTKVTVGLEDEYGFMVEEGIDVAHEYHCELLVFNGEVLYALPGRCAVPVLKGAGGTYGSALLEEGRTRDAIAALAGRAASALALETGFVHCELLEDRSGRLLVGELGCRPGGAMIPHMLKLQHGVDVPAIQASLARGVEPRIDWKSSGSVVALRGVPADAGRVIDVTGVEEVRSMPGVVDVVQILKTGDTSLGSVGTANFAGFVFCEGRTSGEASERAAAAAARWQVVVEPTTSH